mmetsp:Transcript_35406/g.100259  ORF Transcript_35406/g.100259 Transcript_35406/m.100259 type:complete len:149 (+) Transcript_35406:214-660(+)
MPERSNALCNCFHQLAPQSSVLPTCPLLGTVTPFSAVDEKQSSGKLYTSILYPGSKSTEVRCRMSLRSLHKGANNRIDIHELITYDRELGRALPQPSSLGSETSDDENIPNRNVHNRGLNTYVFVPWEWMNSTVLNLSLEEMDYFVPG